MGEPDVPVGTARARGPSPARTARTREGIVAAALDTFLEQGFEGTRMIDVAQRAGVAKGTLYLHFTDKEALFEGVLRQVIEAPLAGLAGLTRADGEPLRAFLSRVGRLMLEDMESSRRGPVIRLVVAEAARFPALAAMYRRMVIEPATAAIAELAREARAAGELRGDALERFPQLLAAPVVLATLWNGLFGPDEPWDAVAMFDAHLDMIVTAAPSRPPAARGATVPEGSG